ncbi:MAG: phosphopyruvate hydratase [Patescibacteria group bacterium]
MSSINITKCNAYKIKDSRGEDTLEVEMSAGEISVWASVPSGKSTGTREAMVLPVDKAIENINNLIAPEIIGLEVNFRQIDDFILALDGTENKSKLGANAILGISIAVLKLEAKIQHKKLWKHISDITESHVSFPRLFANVINGGPHAGFKLPFQEYMFVLGDGTNSIETFEQLKVLFELLRGKIEDKENVIMGDEGGFSFDSKNIEEPFEILSSLHDTLAIDVAAEEFFDGQNYKIADENYSADALLEIYKKLVGKFPLESIEDPFGENDFEAFRHLVTGLPNGVLVVGDDLTTTNPKMISKVIDENLANCILIKPNQIGTVSETLEAIKKTHEAGLKTIISHRSGETMDSFIADLAVGVGAYGIKTGSPSQPERMAKYERLMEIEKEMNS